MKPFLRSMAWILLLLPPVYAQAAVPKTSTVEKDSCEWQAGTNPYTGDKEQAVDELTSIPAPTRAKLKEMMRTHSYSDQITIHKDKIVGQKGTYDPYVANMRFGWNGRCKQVTRDKWTAGTTQTALVYTADGYSIIDPSVCRNIAQIYAAPPEPIDISPAAGIRQEEPSTAFEPPPPVAAAPSFAQEAADPVVTPVAEQVYSPIYNVTWETGGGIVNEITVVAVPEPSSWGMMLSGLMLLGFMSRRKKV